MGAARRLACRRLRALHELLPSARRPPVPFPLDNAGPDGSVAADALAVATALRDWWRGLHAAVADADLDDLAVVVFGLPGAERP